MSGCHSIIPIFDVIKLYIHYTWYIFYNESIHIKLFIITYNLYITLKKFLILLFDDTKKFKILKFNKIFVKNLFFLLLKFVNSAQVTDYI